MTLEYQTQKEADFNFEQMIVSEYLKYGSVEEMISANDYSLPISFAGIHRVLDKWGIVKTAGPNKPLTEIIGFFVKFVEKKIPLETLYKRMPPSFTPSMATLHRVYRIVKDEVKKNISERIMRRYGTALLLHPHKNPNLALIGRDVSPARLDVGRIFGAHSFPMGFSKMGEDKSDSILRVMQKEVFTDQVLNKCFPAKVIKDIAKLDPFMYLDIADVRVGVYSYELPRGLSPLNNFSSFKLKNYEYVDVRNLAARNSLEGEYRLGMVEIARGYTKYLENRTDSPALVTSDFNLAIARQE